MKLWLAAALVLAGCASAPRAAVWNVEYDRESGLRTGATLTLMPGSEWVSLQMGEWLMTEFARLGFTVSLKPPAPPPARADTAAAYLAKPLPRPLKKKKGAASAPPAVKPAPSAPPVFAVVYFHNILEIINVETKDVAVKGALQDYDAEVTREDAARLAEQIYRRIIDEQPAAK